MHTCTWFYRLWFSGSVDSGGVNGAIFGSLGGGAVARNPSVSWAFLLHNVVSRMLPCEVESATDDKPGSDFYLTAAQLHEFM